jgi:penicillin-binding protein 1A
LLRHIFKIILGLSVIGFLIISVAGFFTYKRLEPQLPDIDTLADVELHVPLSVYTSDGKLIAEFGEKRREQLHIEQTPQVLIDAVIASEDDRFYEHPGVDYQGLIRAGINLIKTGRKGQGGSTITMQVARNIYLSPEKTYLRKINEILLALKIERQLSKESILELYMNIPYLGNRAYGAASAAKVYYGKDVSELTLAEAAMIAGLPKAPSLYNPIVNPERALVRRNYVLRRMRELDKITVAEFEQAKAQPVTAKLHRTASETEAGYVSEMARAQMVNWLGSAAYTGGYRVYTTIDSRHQLAATKALRRALIDYEKRHGFRLPGKATKADVETQDAVDELLATLPAHGDLAAALVTETSADTAYAILQGGDRIEIPWRNIEWASPRSEEDKELPLYTTPGEVLQPLDLIYVEQVPVPTEEAAEGEQVAEAEPADTTTEALEYALAQMPEVEGALVSLSPVDGKIMALVGGFDFYRSKFNRVTQAYRQPGSNFKPFIYSAALEYGDTAATIYNDTPVVLEDNVLEDEWRPRNYSGRFFGPTRLREALVKSRNLVSIRVLQNLGIPRAIGYAKRFNFESRSLPRNLSLVLGSGDMTPLQLAAGYTPFASGGYLVPPHFIEKIYDGDDRLIYQASAVEFCDTPEQCAEMQNAVEDIADGAESEELTASASEYDDESPLLAAAEPEADTEIREIPQPPDRVAAPRAIEERNAFIMRSIMKEVVRRGTATRAKALGRGDLAGKTGTTNDLYDAWFTGFNSELVATAWVGYDEQTSLGNKESGGVAALPMWIDYMRVALDGVAEDREFQPEGISTVRVDRKTGKLAAPGSDNAYFEFFRDENIPTEYAERKAPTPQPKPQPRREVVLVQDGTKPSNETPAAPVQRQQPVVREPQAPSSQKKKIEQLF